MGESALSQIPYCTFLFLMPMSSRSEIESMKSGLSSPSERGTRGEAVVAIFDIGKTNKKLFLFDEHYEMVFERSERFTETLDDDGEACENVENLRLLVLNSLSEVLGNRDFDVKAINFSAYGASLVNVDSAGTPVTPLYNYLKPFPQDLQKQFYDTYGGVEKFCYITASPVLGHLNSGMQLYWLKHRKPQLYDQIKYSLHLPQYVSSLVSRKFYSDITSIGCHTNLWDFSRNDYHEWVYKEEIINKLAPIVPSDHVDAVCFQGNNYPVGIGLHDSSAALIPYLVSFKEPFILISTGTWCISLNPFSHQPLTAEELECDCLAYMTYDRKPVKASRLFAGNEHEQQVERIGQFFNQNALEYRSVEFNSETVASLRKRDTLTETAGDTKELLANSLFAKRDLSGFSSYAEAYHQLIADIITQQYASTQLVLKGTSVKRIFVDGGFGKNPIYMNLLAAAFPDLEVFAASMSQATAVGTALAIHASWNKKALPNNLIELKYFSAKRPKLRAN